MANPIPFLPWKEFYETLYWRQGEHVSVFGRTGSGKTVMTTELIGIRNGYTVAFGVKPEDESLDYLIEHEGFVRITSWPPTPPEPGHRKYLLWPYLSEIEDIDRYQPLFKRALGEIYAQRGWTIYIDEVRYVAQRLGLAKELTDIWILGRSSHLTLVGCTQRLSWVPLEMLTQATHVFVYRINGEADLKRLRAIDVGNRDAILSAVSELPQYHCLYINTVTGEALTTKAER